MVARWLWELKTVGSSPAVPKSKGYLRKEYGV